jgi:hypothetical protein
MEEAAGPKERLEAAKSELNPQSIELQVVTFDSQDDRYDSSFLLKSTCGWLQVAPSA